MILLGDCLVRLKELPDNSVDSVVTDPPYGWRFMGKAWDGADIEKMAKATYSETKPSDVGRPKGMVRTPQSAANAAAGSYDNSPSANQAFQVFTESYCRELYRVLKPGGHMLVFCGPRTYHRMASGVEDAGFEIRDQLQWLFGSGFPKSHDISKGIDKAAGAEREIVGERAQRGMPKSHADQFQKNTSKHSVEHITAPSTDAAKKWQGWGTALKPSNEPVVLAMKPLTGAYLLDSLAHECQSKLLALIAKKYSALNQSVSVAAASIAQWLAEKNTPTRDGLSDQMATLQSESEKNSVLSTELSWLNILAEVSKHASTFITEMASSLTTDLKILSYSLSSSTQASTIQGEIGLDGQLLTAWPVENLFLALKCKLDCILTPSVHANVFAEGAHLKSLLDERVTNEPIVLARKPLSESTVAKNVIRWGTGGLNIDVSRVKTNQNCDSEDAWENEEHRSDLLASNVKKSKRHSAQVSKESSATKSAELTSSASLQGLIDISTTDTGCTAGPFLAETSTMHDENLNLSTELFGKSTTEQSREASTSITSMEIKPTIESKISPCSQEKSISQFTQSAETLSAQQKLAPKSQPPAGRWPSNLILDETAAAMLDLQSGTLKSGGGDKGNKTIGAQGYGSNTSTFEHEYKSDSGGASRFFYCAKASKSERNAGLEGMPEVEKRTMNDYGDQSKHACSDGANRTKGTGVSKNQNHHPTVKPIRLMEYLIKLITPPGGTVLDPFMGSGSTGVAAFKNGFKFIGCEMSAEYVEIAEKRMAHASAEGA